MITEPLSDIQKSSKEIYECNPDLQNSICCFVYPSAPFDSFDSFSSFLLDSPCLLPWWLCCLPNILWIISAIFDGFQNVPQTENCIPEKINFVILCWTNVLIFKPLTLKQKISYDLWWVRYGQTDINFLVWRKWKYENIGRYICIKFMSCCQKIFQ